MKLAIEQTPQGQKVHIVPQSMFSDDPDAHGATEQTACGIALEDLDSPELGEHQIDYRSIIPTIDTPGMCPNCKRVYENEQTALRAWNERTLK